MTYKSLNKIIYKDLALGLLAISCIFFSSCSIDKSLKEKSENLPSKTTSTSFHTSKEKKTSAKSKKITSPEDKDSSSLVKLEDPPQPVELKSKHQPTSCTEAKKWEGTWKMSAIYDKSALISLEQDQTWKLFSLDNSDLPTTQMDIEVTKVSDSTKLPEGIHNAPQEMNQKQSNNSQFIRNCPDIQKWIGTWRMSVPYSPSATVILHPDYRWSLIQNNELGIPYRLLNIDTQKISNTNTSLHPKGIESKAKSAIGAINRAQQAHRFEHPTFASSFNELGIHNIFAADEFYDIQIVSADAKQAYVTARSKRSDTKSFSGITIKKSRVNPAEICETKSASQTPPPINCYLSLSNTVPAEPAHSREADARGILRFINRIQEDHRAEHPTFVNSIDSLEIVSSHLAHKYYDIQIVSADANHAYITARSKYLDAKSYSSIVTLKGNRITSKICETQSKSQTPPPINCTPYSD